MTTRKGARPGRAGKARPIPNAGKTDTGKTATTSKTRRPRQAPSTAASREQDRLVDHRSGAQTPVFRRPEPARTQPIRNWSGLFGGAASVPNANPAVAAARGFMDAATSAATSATLPLGDAVARGVDLGYRVIDDYVRRGQQAARAAWSRSDQASDHIRGDASQAAPPDPQRLMERMVQYASDFTSVWFEMLNLASSAAGAGRAVDLPATAGGAGPFRTGGAAQPADPAATRGTAAPRGETSATASTSGGTAPRRRPGGDEGHQVGNGTGDTKVSVELSSRRRTTASVELRGGSAELDLVAHDLRTADPKVPRLRGVRLVPRAAKDQVIVKIRVPDGQAAGAYSGLIVDRDTNLPRGSITVRVEP